MALPSGQTHGQEGHPRGHTDSPPISDCSREAQHRSRGCRQLGWLPDPLLSGGDPSHKCALFLPSRGAGSRNRAVMDPSAHPHQPDRALPHGTPAFCPRNVELAAPLWSTSPQIPPTLLLPSHPDCWGGTVQPRCLQTVPPGQHLPVGNAARLPNGTEVGDKLGWPCCSSRSTGTVRQELLTRTTSKKGSVFIFLTGWG